MYPHSALHIVTFAFMLVAVIAILVVLIVRLCRGDMAFVRQRLSIYIGMVLLLTGTGLNGGRYDLLAVIIRLAGGGIMLIGAVRLGQKQAIDRKEWERLERAGDRTAL